LRFPEFTGEWKEATIGECCAQLEYGMNASSKKFDGENKYIRITDIDEDSCIYKTDDIVSPDGDLLEKYLVHKNDILLARTGASTGKAYLYNPNDGKMYYAGFLIKASVNPQNNSRYVFLQTQTKAYKKWVSITSMRSGQPGINSQEFAAFSFCLPPSRIEQDRISLFFEKLDERIATQRKVIERLETLINGLNNRLHECYANSIESSFDELGYDYNGLSGKTADDFGNGKPYIPYVNVNKNAVVCTDNLPLVEIDSKEAQNKVMWGDIIFTLSSETPEEVAIGAVYLGDIKDLYLNSFCFGIRITDNVRVYKPYMAYFVSSRMFRRFVFPLAQGSTRYNLHKVDFMEKRFLLPSYENQVKISNLLTAYSTKIAVERQLLVRLNTQKLVLLSKLFI
jgi:type I restriction enzyme S subunit